MTKRKVMEKETRRTIFKITLEELMKKKKVGAVEAIKDLGEEFWRSVIESSDRSGECYLVDVRSYIRLSKYLGVEPGVLSRCRKIIPKRVQTHQFESVSINKVRVSEVIERCGGVSGFAVGSHLRIATVRGYKKSKVMLRDNIERLAGKVANILGESMEHWFDYLTDLEQD